MKKVLIVLFALFCTLLAVTVGLLLRIVCAVTPVGTLTFFAALAAASKAVLLEALAAAFALAQELPEDAIVVVTETEYTGAGKHIQPQLDFARENGIETL